MIRLLRDIFAFVIAIIEILLIIRFILKLLGASTSSQFVAWIYTNTQALLQPFTFAFPNPSISTGLVIEFTTLFALFAYAFIGYIIEYFLTIMGNGR